MKSINIVLLQPQIPQNTGNIARTCAATGAHLHLVGPMGFVIEDKKLKRAGLDYWDKLGVSYYESTKDFFSKNPDGKFYYFTTKARHRYTDVNYEDNVYIVFGREDKGIDEEILFANPDTCVRMPMLSNIRSLNLSNTVAIATYEILRQWDFEGFEPFGNLTKYNWE
ncbi:MAG: tRNA (cytidine(34)-2'-O)-methyltransferase [Oscillospiraceae bacterium]|nr:tRNA (cytidine(34)-2'-O)-methyltransferase [Oscillospiraceae bacterium]